VVYSVLADLVVVLHLCFVIFVLLGGFLVLWKSCVTWFHIPAVIWGAALEFLGWTCPLTPLENLLRLRAGNNGYATGFVEHYMVPLIYPTAINRRMQTAFGIIVLAVNIIVYLALWQKIRKKARGQG
jgi:hypothetical protein